LFTPVKLRSQPAHQVAVHDDATAADLDCWLWHRPPVGAIDQSGDGDLLSEFTAAIAPGIN